MQAIVVFQCQDATLTNTRHQRSAKGSPVSGFIDVTARALKPDIVRLKTKMARYRDSPVVSSVPFRGAMRTTGDAAITVSQTGLTAQLVDVALRKLQPVTDGFYNALWFACWCVGKDHRRSADGFWFAQCRCTGFLSLLSGLSDVT
ncbi:hypothetical protein GM31_18235 [Trabulsiella odontotermitis]|uniref:Uncharacterized protein n=1 Tax=Trabulsiella odontotermitis TaxID=379893 RepID=A0A0L0GX54_9ENTR|nr:hypothetical protein GM31_18235 [Trabulsiella odontotermitis]